MVWACAQPLSSLPQPWLPPPSLDPSAPRAPCARLRRRRARSGSRSAAGPARSMIYRTLLARRARTTAIRRALIMVHGTNRNADHYFETAAAAAFLAGALDDTVVIAPHMIDAAATSRAETNEVGWAARATAGAPAAAAVESSRSLVVRLRRRDPAQAREQEHVPEPDGDRRRRPLGRRPVRDALRDGEQGARHARRARHLRRRQPVELRVARRGAAAAAGDADPASREGRLGRAVTRSHTNFTFGPFDAAEGAELQPLAGGSREPHRLHGGRRPTSS